MIFTETKIRGVFIIELESIEDDRGFFARAWCQKEFEQHGLNAKVAQSNIGYSKNRGTLRGMHYQEAPYQEAKLVRCTRGAVFDVVLDLRRNCPTYKRWVGLELTARNHKMLYIPEGCAHGYQTLVHNTEVDYLTSQFYEPLFARGVRYNDPAFGITWPRKVKRISEKDGSWPDFKG